MEKSIFQHGKTFKAASYFFDVSSWGRLDFSNREKVCVGLSCLCALLMLASCCMLIGQRCRVRGRHSGIEAACSLYCFLGNVCSTVGAILYHQLALQVLLGGFMAILDIVNFGSILISVCLCWNSSADRRRRMMRRRRRQNLPAMFGLVLLGAGGSYGYLTSSKISLRPIQSPITGRRLLSDLLQDNSEVLGFVIGLLSFVIACTSKLPALSRAHRGETLSRAHVASGALCSLAGALYAAAILFYDTQPEFILRAMPWLLTATSCAALELLILALYWCRRSSSHQLREHRPDTESLLGGTSPPNLTSSTVTRSRKHTLDSLPLHGALKKKTDMGDYMDVNSQPVRKVCLKQVTLSREGVAESQPLKSTVRVVRVDESCTSDNTSSSLSSDLEWDFDEANPHWNKTTKWQESEDRFPLQEWPKSPHPTNTQSSAPVTVIHP